MRLSQISESECLLFTIYIVIITSVLRLLHRICIHCYTYHTTFIHFLYLQLDIFTLINIINLNDEDLSSYGVITIPNHGSKRLCNRM